MAINNNYAIKSAKYLVGIFVLWFITFQFIIEINSQLKPGYILLNLLNVLLIHFYSELLYTFINIYLPLFLSYFLIKAVLIYFAGGKNQFVIFLFSLCKIFKYIPPILPGIILIFLFPGSFYLEFAFILFISILSIFLNAVSLLQKVPEEAVINISGFNGIPGRVINSVKWNFIKPQLIKKIRIIHFQLWTLIIAFELINKEYGIGDILYFAINNKYLSVIIAITIICGLTIYLVNKLLIMIEKKYTFEID